MVDLQTLLSQPPTSFAWSTSADGQRTIGTAPGAICDIWPDRVEVATIYPPDDLALAVHNGTLLLLVLTALRPDWAGASDWLKVQMRLAAKSKSAYEGANYSKRVVFAFDRTQSRASLRVRL